MKRRIFGAIAVTLLIVSGSAQWAASQDNYELFLEAPLVNVEPVLDGFIEDGEYGNSLFDLFATQLASLKLL